MIISQAPQMEVSRKREVESIDGVPRVTTNPFLAEKQDSEERVAKMQKVESKEGKPHLTTNPSLAEKQEVETAKKPYSKIKNEEVAMPVESPKASESSSDSDPDEGEYWPIIEVPDDQPVFYQWSDGYGDSDSGDETFKKWKRENEDGYNDGDSDSDSDDETHKKGKEENKD